MSRVATSCPWLAVRSCRERRSRLSATPASANVPRKTWKKTRLMASASRAANSGVPRIESMAARSAESRLANWFSSVCSRNRLPGSTGATRMIAVSRSGRSMA